LKLADIGRLRLRNQRVAGGKLRSAVDVVSWLGAVQSQEYPYAKWSLGMRATGLSDASVDGSLRDGEIIRTHIMRPTWHFVAPADLRWMMALTGPRVARTLRSTADQRIPEESVIAKAFEAIVSELEGGRRLSRAAIVELLTERRIIGAKVWAIPIFIRAELELLLCSGGLDGNNRPTRSSTSGWHLRAGRLTATGRWRSCHAATSRATVRRPCTTSAGGPG